MRFDYLMRSLDNLRKLPGIGPEAHEAVFPNVAQHREEALKKDPTPRISAVAAILMPVGSEASILLIERQTYPGVHSGQIGFPGGRMELYDANLEQCARRETQEELGIAKEAMTLVRPMSHVYIPPSRFLVHPFIFVLEQFPDLVPDAREVRSTLVLPVAQLLDDAIMEEGTVPLNDGVKLKTRYFRLGDKKIWGATAMMLNEVKVLLKHLN